MNQLQMLKMTLISYVTNSAKAIWSAIAHPLAIVGSKKCNLKDYKIYGGGKNLLDVNKWFPNYVNDEGGITFKETNLADIIYNCKINLDYWKQNTSYTFSCDYEITNAVNNSVYITFIYTDGTTDTRWGCLGGTTTGSKSGKCTETSYSWKTVKSVQLSYATATRTISVKLTNMLIKEGATATEYEPYQYTDNFPVTVRGKNILDMSKQTVSVGYYTDSAGTPNSNSRFVRISSIAVKPSTTYTISSNLFFYNIWFFKSLADADKISGMSVSKTQKKTFTTPEGCAYIRVSMDLKMTEQEAEGVSAFKWAMLETGEGDGVYEPYIEPQTINIFLDEPLGAGEVIQQSVDGLPNLPQYKGTTIYEVQTDTPPSGIEVCYYG